MSPNHFDFNLEASDASQFLAMLGELATSVLAFAGLSNETAADLLADVNEALAAAGSRPCTVRFSARPGTLTIAISCSGTPIARLSHDLA